MDGVVQLIGSKSKPQHGRPITKRQSCHLRPPLKVTIADRLDFFSYCLSLQWQLIPFTAFSLLLFLCHLNLFLLLSQTSTLLHTLRTFHHFYFTLALSHSTIFSCLIHYFACPFLSTSFCISLTSLSQSFALSPAVSSLFFYLVLQYSLSWLSLCL